MKKEVFKRLIKEFHESPPVEVIDRDLVLPLSRKIITLTGARRTGKTFCFYQFIQRLAARPETPKHRVLYLNFEDDRLFPLRLQDLDDLLEAYYELYPENKGKELYCFFDEIQNVPNWEVFVRRISEREKARIWVTGSSAKLLSKEIATALRGRTLAFQLFPLSFREFLRFKRIALDEAFAYSSARFKIKKAFEEYLVFGGFPEVVLEPRTLLKRSILANYFEMLLYKDVVERFAVRNTLLLKSLAKYLATNVSTLFSLNAYHRAVSRELAVGKDTVVEYLAHLEDVQFLYLVPFFSYSLKKQQRRPKKVYCVDNGLRNAVAFSFSQDLGRLAENLVFLELKRREREVFYWKNGNEVDFVVKNEDASLEAINVSYTNEPAAREASALKAFKKEFKKTVRLTLLTQDLEKKENGIAFVPLWKWLLTADRACESG